MLEFASKILKLKFNDKEYQVKYPTVDQLHNYSEDMKGKEGQEILCIKDLLATLGLPTNVSGSMEISHLEAIMLELSKAKK